MSHVKENVCSPKSNYRLVHHKCLDQLTAERLKLRHENEVLMRLARAARNRVHSYPSKEQIVEFSEALRAWEAVIVPIDPRWWMEKT